MFSEKILWHLKNSSLVMQLYIIAINSMYIKNAHAYTPMHLYIPLQILKIQGEKISKDMRKNFKKKNLTLILKIL